ncbi:MAG TPA: M50 family metallopeptidase [Candidatus Saccharimonadales bacterium]
MTIFIFVLGIVLFISLIVMHEFGHFVVARRNGVVAEEFAIFFGPSIYSREMRGGWTFKINTLPLGGYVKLKGEHDSDTEPGSYGAASLWAKTKIMSAGVFVNIVVGVVLLTILSLIGMPQIIPNQYGVNSGSSTIKHSLAVTQINEVLSGSPAANANLKAGDDITAIGPKGNVAKISSISDLQTATKKFAGQKVNVYYTRDKKQLIVPVTLNSTAIVAASQNSKQPKAYLGVSLNSASSGVTLVRNTWSAPLVALGLSKQVVVLTYQGLGHALNGLGGIIAGTATDNTNARKNAQSSAAGQLVGPVGVFVILKDGSSIGIQFMLFIIAIISITLGLMNILPIPALDGGRLWLTLGSRAIRKPLNARNEELINAVGMLVLFLLLGIITYVDIKRFF